MQSVTLERQFTATAYIHQDNKALLIFHPKFGKWMPPGGHVHPGETPPETAKREALEETGFEIEIIPDEHHWVQFLNGKSIERPYMCMLFDIPQQGNTPPHQHIDFIYLAKPKEKTGEPIHPTRWFTIEEIKALPEKEMFKDARLILNKLLS